MNDSPNVSVSLDHREGVSGKVVAWSVLIALLVGLGLGVWGAASFLRFEPSEEYRENQAELRILRGAVEDSLEVARERAEEADAAIMEAAVAEDQARMLADDARDDAERHRRRADSLSAERGGEEDVGLLLAENTALRASLQHMEEAASFRAMEIRERDNVIGALWSGVYARDSQISLLTAERNALVEAIDMANAEIARATGGIGSQWYLPRVTIGYGCKLDSCGPVVAAGISFSPWGLLK